METAQIAFRLGSATDDALTPREKNLKAPPGSSPGLSVELLALPVGKKVQKIDVLMLLSVDDDIRHARSGEERGLPPAAVDLRIDPSPLDVEATEIAQDIAGLGDDHLRDVTVIHERPDGRRGAPLLERAVAAPSCGDAHGVERDDRRDDEICGGVASAAEIHR